MIDCISVTCSIICSRIVSSPATSSLITGSKEETASAANILLLAPSASSRSAFSNLSTPRLIIKMIITIVTANIEARANHSG